MDNGGSLFPVICVNLQPTDKRLDSFKTPSTTTFSTSALIVFYIVINSRITTMLHTDDGDGDDESVIPKRRNEKSEDSQWHQQNLFTVDSLWGRVCQWKKERRFTAAISKFIAWEDITVNDLFHFIHFKSIKIYESWYCGGWCGQWNRFIGTSAVALHCNDRHNITSKSRRNTCFIYCYVLKKSKTKITSLYRKFIHNGSLPILILAALTVDIK